MARAHGLRGDVVVELVTNREERVAAGSVLYVGERRRLEVRSSTPAGASGARRRFIVSFAGVDNRDAADALRGQVLRADAIDDPDALWVHDLVGAAVADAGGATIGTVVAVQANPASDLLVLDSGALIPLRFVTGSEPGRVTVDLPAGLLDL